MWINMTLDDFLSLLEAGDWILDYGSKIRCRDTFSCPIIFAYDSFFPFNDKNLSNLDTEEAAKELGLEYNLLIDIIEAADNLGFAYLRPQLMKACKL